MNKIYDLSWIVARAIKHLWGTHTHSIFMRFDSITRLNQCVSVALELCRWLWRSDAKFQERRRTCRRASRRFSIRTRKFYQTRSRNYKRRRVPPYSATRKYSYERRDRILCGGRRSCFNCWCICTKREEERNGDLKWRKSFYGENICVLIEVIYLSSIIG